MKTRSTVLTKEELDVLILATQHPGGSHLSNEEIAQRLGISVNKVKTLIHQACLKLGARNRNEAILTAMRQGEMRLDDFYSLEELAEVCCSLGPDMLRKIARLLREEIEHGDLLLDEEQIVCTRRGADALLTDRERDVLALCWRGLTNAEIGDKLCMSANSVRSFLSRACAKLGARKRIDALVIALKRREISIGDLASLDEMLQLLKPLGPDSIDKTAQLLDQQIARGRVTVSR